MLGFALSVLAILGLALLTDPATPVDNLPEGWGENVVYEFNTQEQHTGNDSSEN